MAGKRKSIPMPGLSTLAGEGWGLAAGPRLVLAIPSLARLPRGSGEPVMVLPGFGTGDASTIVLRGLLGHLGYRVEGWGLGINTGDVEARLPRVIERVRALAKKARRPVRLVGWSLGGVFARETARDAPEAVARVITMGTPVIGGPKYTQVGFLYRVAGFDLDTLERRIKARHDVPIKAPITAIYTKNDGIVAWQACIDRWSPDVEHIEVHARHLTLGVDPLVLRLVAQRLAPALRVA
jgi:pimeloyl-ACP methyl ester carboxylesterase